MVVRIDMRDPNCSNNAYIFANLRVYSSFIRQNTNKTQTDFELNISILHVLGNLDESTEDQGQELGVRAWTTTFCVGLHKAG